MAKTKALPRDPAERLTDRKAIASFLNAAIEDGDPAVITAALGTIARAEGMTRIAKNAGLTRASLYKALDGQTKPEFATILRVMKAVGIRLSARAV